MRSLFLISTLAFAVCGQPQPFEPEIPVSLDESFVLRVDQAATVAGTPLRIAFQQVLQDSRCPSDVVCVWAGNARVRLAVTLQGDGEAAVDLNTGLDPRSSSVPGYEITLEEVQPETTTTSSIPPADYLARLRVTQAP